MIWELWPISVHRPHYSALDGGHATDGFDCKLLGVDGFLCDT